MKPTARFSGVVLLCGGALVVSVQHAAAQGVPTTASRGETVVLPTIGVGLGGDATRIYAGFQLEKVTGSVLAISVLADAWVIPQVCADAVNPNPGPSRCITSGWDLLAGPMFRSARGHSHGAVFAGAGFGLSHAGNTHTAAAARFGFDYPLSSKVSASAELRVTRILGGADETTKALHVGLRIGL
jgi:hypothetical protein